MGEKVSCKYSLGTIIKAPLWHVSADIYFLLREDQNYSLIIHRVLKRYSILFKKSLTGLQEKSTKLPSTLIRQSNSKEQPQERVGRGRWESTGRDVTPGQLWGHILGHLSLHSCPGRRIQLHSTIRAQLCPSLAFPWGFTGHRSPQQAESSSWFPYIPSKVSDLDYSFLYEHPFPNPRCGSFNNAQALGRGSLCHPREVIPACRYPGWVAVSGVTEQDTGTDVWCPLLAPTATGPGKSCLDQNIAECIFRAAWRSVKSYTWICNFIADEQEVLTE